MTLAVAFSQRLKPSPLVRCKYDQLVREALIRAAEFELAARSARRQGSDLETVLNNEFQVKFLQGPFRPA